MPRLTVERERMLRDTQGMWEERHQHESARGSVDAMAAAGALRELLTELDATRAELADTRARFEAHLRDDTMPVMKLECSSDQEMLIRLRAHPSLSFIIDDAELVANAVGGQAVGDVDSFGLEATARRLSIAQAHELLVQLLRGTP